MSCRVCQSKFRSFAKMDVPGGCSSLNDLLLIVPVLYK